jgi:hypothetical protein
MSGIATDFLFTIDQPETQAESGKRWPFQSGAITSSSA